MFGDGKRHGNAVHPDAGDCAASIILGHPERRGSFGTTPHWLTSPLQALFADSKESVNQKACIVMRSPLTTIICVGETIDERKAGKTDDVVRSQVEAALQGLDKGRLGEVVLAYEPVWDIGTGETCDSAEAQRVCQLIRNTVAAIDTAAAGAMRIQYGGSVKPENIKEFMDQPEIDGALVGGASLEMESFIKIIKY